MFENVLLTAAANNRLSFPTLLILVQLYSYCILIPRAGEGSSHGGVQGMTTDQLAGPGIQEPASVARIAVSPSLRGAYQYTLGAEADYAQVEFVGRQNLTAVPNLAQS